MKEREQDFDLDGACEKYKPKYRTRYRGDNEEKEFVPVGYRDFVPAKSKAHVEFRPSVLGRIKKKTKQILHVLYIGFKNLREL